VDLLDVSEYEWEGFFSREHKDKSVVKKETKTRTRDEGFIK
jgi:hypothetical protein